MKMKPFCASAMATEDGSGAGTACLDMRGEHLSRPGGSSDITEYGHAALTLTSWFGQLHRCSFLTLL